MRDRPREVTPGRRIPHHGADASRRGGLMIGLYTVAEVRAAEAPVLAATPEGTLMQRAATGLATRGSAATSSMRK